MSNLRRNRVVIREGKMYWRICLSNYKLHASKDTQTFEIARANTHALLCAHCITGAMIYRRATMCVEVSTERNERLLTTTLRSNAVDFVEARRAFFPRARRRFVHQSIDWFV